MKVKIKKLHEDAVIPTYAHATDGAMDLYVTRTWFEENSYGSGRMWCVGTGVAMEIPEGYVGLVFPRSSISKTDLFQRNAVGVIDADYRGEITIKFGYYDGHGKGKYEVGDRCGQIMILPRPTIEFVEVTELSDTERGAGGYGSTGQ